MSAPPRGALQDVGSTVPRDAEETLLTEPRSGRQRSARGLPRLLGSVAIWRLLLLVAILVAWQLLSGPIINPIFVSSPSKLVSRLIELFRTGTVWRDIAATYSAVAYGYFLAAVVGIGSGILLGRVHFLADVLEPFIMGAYSIPKIALAPLFILWLGIGAPSKIGIAFLSAFFLIFYASYSAIRNLDEEVVTTARLLGARRRDVILRVVLPLAAPFIMTGLRTGLPFAVIGTVVGEFMAANAGLGFYILLSSSTLDSTGAFAGITILVAGVAIANSILEQLERRLISWRHNDREAIAA